MTPDDCPGRIARFALLRRHAPEEAEDLRLALDCPEERVDAHGDAPTRMRYGEHLLDLTVEALHVPLGESGIEPALVAEMAVEDRLRDAGLGRDLVHRGIGPAPPDHAVGRGEELAPLSVEAGDAAGTAAG